MEESCTTTRLLIRYDLSADTVTPIQDKSDSTFFASENGLHDKLQVFLANHPSTNETELSNQLLLINDRIIVTTQPARETGELCGGSATTQLPPLLQKLSYLSSYKLIIFIFHIKRRIDGHTQ